MPSGGRETWSNVSAARKSTGTELEQSDLYGSRQAKVAGKLRGGKTHLEEVEDFLGEGPEHDIPVGWGLGPSFGGCPACRRVDPGGGGGAGWSPSPRRRGRHPRRRLHARGGCGAVGGRPPSCHSGGCVSCRGVALSPGGQCPVACGGRPS